MAMDHSSCEHPRTPAGRAWCRANGGPGSGAVYGGPKATPAPRPVIATRKQSRKEMAELLGEIDDRAMATHTTPTPRSSRTVSLGDLPGTFRAAVQWANANGCTVTTESVKDQKLVKLANDNGTLTLTWRPSTPDGVNAVSFRPANTSVTSKLATVNDGLAKLKG